MKDFLKKFNINFDYLILNKKLSYFLKIFKKFEGSVRIKCHYKKLKLI